MSASLCLSPAARRSIFATTRILSRKKTALGTEQEWNPEDSWRSCKSVSHGTSTLRRLHTSSSFGKNVFLKLHCPQSIQSVDEKALQNLLAAISNDDQMRKYQWTLSSPLAAASTLGGNKPTNYFCITAASTSSTTSSTLKEGSAPQTGELDTGMDTILVDMCHDIDDTHQAEAASNTVQRIVKSCLCGDQKNILVYVLRYEVQCSEQPWCSVMCGDLT